MPTTYSLTALPDVIGEDYESRRVMKTMRSPWESARDQSRALDGLNLLWAFKLGWGYLQQSNAEKLLHAYEYVGGEWGSMLWFDWIRQDWANALVGTANGTATSYTLPAKGVTQVQQVRVTDPATSATTVAAGNLVLNGGSNGEDRFVFTTAPAAGLIIRADFTGRRRRKVRMTEFSLSPRRGGSGLWTASAELIETEVSDL